MRDTDSWRDILRDATNLTAKAIVGLLVIFALIAQCHAHTLQPGECVAYASDAARFDNMKNEGYSVDDAQESLRQMLEDGRWFAYVRDKEDVTRMRTIVTSIWSDLSEPVAPDTVRDAALNSCDPNNDEQYQLRQWVKPRGI